MLQRKRGTSSKINKYSTVNNKHNREDLCSYLRNQQTCTSNNHNYIKGGPIFNPFFLEEVYGRRTRVLAAREATSPIPNLENVVNLSILVSLYCCHFLSSPFVASFAYVSLCKSNQLKLENIKRTK